MEKGKGKKIKEINPDDLKEHQCVMFDMGNSKGVLCKENGKIAIYELDKIEKKKSVMPNV
jgi:hypothetical protein